MKRQFLFVLMGISLALSCRASDSGSVRPLEQGREPVPMPKDISLADQSAPREEHVSAEDEDSQCVRVPSGTLNGSKVAELCMDVTETTVDQFRHCVEVGKCSAPSEACSDSLYDQPDRLQYPINCVTQEQAAKYCAWQSKRLPTAVEWQWEAQGGGEARPYPWGDAPPSCDRANLYFGGTIPPSPLGDCGRNWSPVGSFPDGASRHGVLDLQGNVSEWTSDLGPAGAIVKGVAANVDFSHEGLDPSFVQWADPSHPSSTVGFRCVRELR